MGTATDTALTLLTHGNNKIDWEGGWLCQDPMILDMERSQKLGEIGARVLRSDKNMKLKVRYRKINSGK